MEVCRSTWNKKKTACIFFLQPAFVNNPFCGLVIFASLFVQDYNVGLGCLLGGSIATIGELVR